jgi:hypothetical protein
VRFVLLERIALGDLVRFGVDALSSPASAAINRA